MKLSCPRCGQEVAAEDINIQSAVAKCGRCAEVFGFADQVAGARDASDIPAKSPVDMPKGVSVERDAVSMTIVRSWFHPVLFFLILFCVAWDSFLVFWYTAALGGRGPSGGGRLIMMIFPVGHVAVGLGLTYYVLCGFLNKTRIRVSRSELTVRHAPLPWRGEKTLSSHEVDQLFCEEKVTRGKNGPSTSYHVGAVMRDGKRLDLLAGLQSSEQARFIEQEVERCLGIKDRPVSGEMRGA
ncbi:MAG: hypothetical protein HY924_11885 [Elusimicrobia bacterium]|nr:hypothetical protein [Elusimicrobiota bacterium]